MDRGCVNRCGSMLPWNYAGEVCRMCLEGDRQARIRAEARMSWWGRITRKTH